MINFMKIVCVLLLVIISTSCGIMTNDKFVYIGHGSDTPNYQLYYDKTKKIFVLLDKRNGCFQKDDTGTCLAFTHEQAKIFREKVLAKIIDIDLKLAKSSFKRDQFKNVKESVLTTSVISIDVGDVYATPIRQIILDRKQQYSLMKGDCKINVEMAAIVTPSDDEKELKVAYSLSFPGINERYDSMLRPFIIDPEYLYEHMTRQSVKNALSIQKGTLKGNRNTQKKLNKYLKKIADEPKAIVG